MVVSVMNQTQNMEWCKAQQIALSVDLDEAAKQQLRFLTAVDEIGCLYDGPALERAIYRYKYCWLPLVAKHMECPVIKGPLVVPLDCEWIWLCHRLNPVQYKRDCEEIFGKIISNLNVVSTTEETSSNQTEIIWNQIYVTEPYHLDLDNPRVLVNGDGLDATVQKTIEYDLEAAVKRQSSFFSKVSKLMKQDDSFFKEAVNRYKAFLHLIKKSSEVHHNQYYSFVPTHDIDLIWHSHQLNPNAYSKDLTAVFGRILDHNDRDSSGISAQKNLLRGFLRTKEIWEITYGRMYPIDKGVVIPKLGTNKVTINGNADMVCHSACFVRDDDVVVTEAAQCFWPCFLLCKTTESVDMSNNGGIIA